MGGGDSITRGAQDTGVDDANGGYLGPLHGMCNARRPTQFVGTQTTGFFYQRHEGYSGMNCATWAARIPALLASVVPDVFLGYFGTNDAASVAGTCYTDIVIPMLAASSTIKVVMGKRFRFGADLDDTDRQAWNAALEPLIRGNALFGTRLFWNADMANACVTAADFYAPLNIHPSSATGFPNMARSWFNFMTANGII